MSLAGKLKDWFLSARYFFVVLTVNVSHFSNEKMLFRTERGVSAEFWLCSVMRRARARFVSDRGGSCLVLLSEEDTVLALPGQGLGALTIIGSIIFLVEGFEKVKREPRTWMILPTSNIWGGGGRWRVCVRDRERGEEQYRSFSQCAEH